MGEQMAEIRDGEGTIFAGPTKRFFVRMLVRDIELAPAIVDLVDNSVDGARRLARLKAEAEAEARDGQDADREAVGDDDPAGQPEQALGQALAGHHVRLRLSGDEFVIEDDCGGIELSAAVEYAFRFGRPEEIDSAEGEVGQFGVGMKRALFKLGEHFVIESVAPRSRFVVEVPVRDWLEDRETWLFPIRDAVEEDHPLDRCGTKIVVTELLPSVRSEFGGEPDENNGHGDGDRNGSEDDGDGGGGDTAFIQRLRSQIEFRHQAALAAGLTITLNGNELHSRPPALLASEELKPRVVEKDLPVNGSVVHLKLYSGFVRLEDESVDTDDPDQFTQGGQAGWYVICNDRMLLFADKSRLTGWGDEIADYHPQYRRFRGYAFLAGDAMLMPWNTAKTMIDEDSPVWRSVRKEIVDALREARTVMNRIKSERQTQGADDRPLATQLEVAQPVALAKLELTPAMKVPPKPPRQPPRIRNVRFGVPTERFDEVAASLGVESPEDVGLGTFDYYYEREIAD